MERLLAFLERYSNLFVFLFFQFLSLTLVFRFNDFHKEVYGSALLAVGGFFQEKNHAIRTYFNLREENNKLMEQNAKLISELILSKQALNACRYRVPYSRKFNVYPDSLFPVSVFSFIPCRVVQNTIYEPYNYFTINKGEKEGIRPEMGVITSDGVAGLVIETSENYSIAMSLLNQHLRISGKIKTSSVHGTVHWRGGNPRIVHFEYIPLHIPIAIGDTVMTSSHSSYFPEGYSIGKVVDVIDPKDGQGFHEILVLLNTDFFKLDNVYLVKNHHKAELDSLEQKTSF